MEWFKEARGLGVGAEWCGLTLMAVRRSCSSSLSLSEKDKLPGLVSSSFCRCPSVGTGRGREEEGEGGKGGREGGREGGKRSENALWRGSFLIFPPPFAPKVSLLELPLGLGAQGHPSSHWPLGVPLVWDSACTQLSVRLPGGQKERY